MIIFLGTCWQESLPGVLDVAKKMCLELMQPLPMDFVLLIGQQSVNMGISTNHSMIIPLNVVTTGLMNKSQNWNLKAQEPPLIPI